MATAVTFDATDIPGMVLQGVSISARQVQHLTRKYWGLAGESRINGERGGRTIRVPILIYDDAANTFDTPRKLSDYVEITLGDLQGSEGDLTLVSESDHDTFTDCVFEGFWLSPAGINKDHAGTLGGNHFCQGMLVFRQVSG